MISRSAVLAPLAGLLLAAAAPLAASAASVGLSQLDSGSSITTVQGKADGGGGGGRGGGGGGDRMMGGGGSAGRGGGGGGDRITGGGGRGGDRGTIGRSSERSSAQRGGGDQRGWRSGDGNKWRGDRDGRRHSKHSKHRNRHVGVGIYVGPGYGYYDSGYYYSGACAWLYRRAVSTGSRYWWRRYEDCID